MIMLGSDVTGPVATPEFRRYRDQDLDDAHRLVCGTIENSYSRAYSPEAVDFFKRYHSKENISADASSGHTLLFYREGRLVGTGTLLGTNIRRVFVLPDEQGRGVGRMIVAELERIAAGNGVGTIELDSSTVSVEFYHRLGYVGEERRSKNLEHGGVLEYVPMTKKLVP